jgi:hypothetical protein
MPDYVIAFLGHSSGHKMAKLFCRLSNPQRVALSNLIETLV